MIIDEFIALNPAAFSNYAGGVGNINLLVSSSVSASINIAPFVIQGMTIPFRSQDKTSIRSALTEMNNVTYTYGGTEYTSDIVGRQQQNTHYYFRLRDTVATSLPVDDAAGNPRELLSPLIFEPYVAKGFENSEFYPLQGNSTVEKKNTVRQQVDRNTGIANPSNLSAIISQSAAFAQVQDSNYTIAGIVRARYEGTKLNSGSVVGNDPALALRSFEGSIYSEDATVVTIKAQLYADREIEEIFFNANTIKSASIMSVQNFPSASNIIFTPEGNVFNRIVTSRVYSIDTDEVYNVDLNGIVTSVE